MKILGCLVVAASLALGSTASACPWSAAKEATTAESQIMILPPVDGEGEDTADS